MTTAPGNTSSPLPAVWFLGAGAVSGVGSLPFLAVTPALEFIARWCPEVPFWPQLRRMSAREAMLPQTFGPHMRHLSALRDEHGFGIAASRTKTFFEALERSDAIFEPSHAAGFYGFVEASRAGAFPAARAVKGQIMGPVTVACSITADTTLFIDHLGCRNAIADYIVRLARWQVDALLKCSSSVVLLLDEAYLGVALRQAPARRAAIVDILKSVILRVRRPGVMVGIHCCDEIPVSLLNEVGADLFSFDAHHGGSAFASDADARRFLESGGHVAWGWIPTLDDLTGVCPVEIVARWRDAATRLGGDEGTERVHARSLVTATCGLAGSSLATCERSFEIARAVSQGFAPRTGSA
ncbi:MAG TPA: hypothetical protein VFH33_03820 [Candidatus Krumholzibacteria bacterium]|nr:hypothetical protein [Candidatus Krumholzibacteria bacterium]